MMPVLYNRNLSSIGRGQNSGRFAAAKRHPEARLDLTPDTAGGQLTPEMWRAINGLVKSAENLGPYGKFIALTAVVVLLTGCTAAGAGITPSYVTHESPSLTPTGTETLAPIQTSTATLTPFPTATPGLRACQVSVYEACDNNIGINAGGAAQAVFSRLTDHLTSAWEQLARYGDSAKRQDYAADMLFSPIQGELTAQRGPDFWEKSGGLGFNSQNYNEYDGVQAVLNADPQGFFKQGNDGIYRAIVEIQEEEDFEFALAAGIRAKFAILYPDLDFADPGVLRVFDDLIRAGVNQAVDENGFKPKARLPWPGADKIFGFQTGDFVEGEGEVCIGYRPKPPQAAPQRNQQLPEKFRLTDYIRGLENRTPGNDEQQSQLDTRGSVMVELAFDPNHRFLRTDIFSLSSPPDPLRAEAEPLDSEPVDERVEIGRWVPCGPAAAPAPEASRTPITTPLGGPALTETAVPPQVTPAETPRPGVTPGPIDTPRPTEPIPPPEATPGAHESTPESGVPTDVPPGPPPEGQPTFVPAPTESMGGGPEQVLTPDY